MNKDIKVAIQFASGVREFGKDYIKKFSCSNLITDNGDKPVYGIAAQYGSLEFIDIDGSFLELAQTKELTSRLPIIVSVDIQDTTYELGHFISEEWKYDYGDTKVSVELIDSILQWEDIRFSGYVASKTDSALNVFSKIQELTEIDIGISTGTRNELAEISIVDGFLPSSSLSRALNTFCEITGLRIYKNATGEIRATFWR